jgi:hypothetical protein
MPKHHLMVGTWENPGAIYVFEFDTDTRSLELIHSVDTPPGEAISWMCFSHDKKAIYGAAMKKWSSYKVNSPTDIVHQASLDMTHDREYQLTPAFQSKSGFVNANSLQHKHLSLKRIRVPFFAYLQRNLHIPSTAPRSINMLVRKIRNVGSTCQEIVWFR